MDNLIYLLNQLNENGETIKCEEDNRLYFTGDLASQAEVEACNNLIDNQGHCNWTNIEMLRNLGYKVWAGDQDSFGWLVGCIKKNGDNRILTYG